MSDTEQIVKDRYIQLLHSYWNTLITINGIFLGIFSVTIISNFAVDSIIVNSIIMLSMLSLWLLVNNYRIQKKFYSELGKMTHAKFNALSLSDLINYTIVSDKKAFLRYQTIKVSEIIVGICFLLNLF